PPSRRPQGYEREGPPGTDGSYDGVRNVTAASHGNPMLMAMTCDFCDQPLPEGAKFCPNCGSPVASTVGTEERKVVTVLFADLVDSTGLAQHLDAERTREVLGMFYDVATEELMALRGQPEKFI